MTVGCHRHSQSFRTWICHPPRYLASQSQLDVMCADTADDLKPNGSAWHVRAVCLRRAMPWSPRDVRFVKTLEGSSPSCFAPEDTGNCAVLAYAVEFTDKLRHETDRCNIGATGKPHLSWHTSWTIAFKADRSTRVDDTGNFGKAGSDLSVLADAV